MCAARIYWPKLAAKAEIITLGASREETLGDTYDFVSENGEPGPQEADLGRFDESGKNTWFSSAAAASPAAASGAPDVFVSAHFARVSQSGACDVVSPDVGCGAGETRGGGLLTHRFRPSPLLAAWSPSDPRGPTRNRQKSQ